jgi:hypothetical protein
MTEVIIMNFGIFGENFIIFGQVKLLKKIQGNKTNLKELIKGLDLIKGFSGYNLGTETVLGANWRQITHKPENRGERRVATWQPLIWPPQDNCVA